MMATFLILGVGCAIIFSILIRAGAGRIVLGNSKAYRR